MLKKKVNTIALDYLKNMKKYPSLMSDWHCFLRFKISIEQSVLGAHGFSTTFFSTTVGTGLTSVALLASSTVAVQPGM